MPRALEFTDHLNRFLCDATVPAIQAVRDRLDLAIMLKSGGPPAKAKRAYTRKPKDVAQLPLAEGAE